MPPRADVLDRIGRLARATPPAALTPVAFFPAWCGVLVLVYDGFPAPLRALQRQIGQLPGAPTLLPGARWAKTTLAALRDDATLTRKQGQALVQTCRDFSARLDPTPICFDSLAYVEFESRSLERRTRTERIALSGREEGTASGSAGGATALVLAQGDDFDAYWPYLSREGHRERHYREPATGTTLVLEVPTASQPGLIEAFLAEVSRVLPDTYVRFRPPSRHVTLHNLSG
jgi:hypothetical protein